MIAVLNIPPRSSGARVLGMMSVDDKLYALGGYYMCVELASSHRRTPFRRKDFKLRKFTTIECYDPDKDEWKKKTELVPERFISVWNHAYSMRVFKGSEFLRKVSSLSKFYKPLQSESKNQETLSDMQNKTKCLVM